ncbi:MAG: hypothetical protein AAF411_14900 [Myxococcota bacterium]
MAQRPSSLPAFMPLVRVGALIVLAAAASCANGDDPPLCSPIGEAPQTIDDALARINALPEPTLACFVASLPRPLRMTATDSTFSAQPAAGTDRPRVFLHTEGLVLSITLGGPGVHLLEFGEWRSPTRTLKGEIAFPVTTPLMDDAPFHLELEGSTREGTSCGLCHRDEEAIEGRPGAFISDALRPRLRDQVNVEYLEYLEPRCDDEQDPEGCALLHALFEHGDVIYEDFDEAVATF